MQICQIKSVENFIIKNSDNEKIWAMLLPVPEFRKNYISNIDAGYLCIELLFDDKKLWEYKKIASSFYEEKIIFDQQIYKIACDSKIKIKFAQSTKDFTVEDFVNFQPLFEKIKEILELSV